MTLSSDPGAQESAKQSPHRVGVILVGAGSGQRLGAGIPKAFVQLQGKSLLERAIETVLSMNVTGHLVVVVPESHAAGALSVLEAETESTGGRWSTNVAMGGLERHFSVMNGLELMPEWVETVLVHDIARPLTPVSQFTQVMHAVAERRAGVVPVLPITDTVKRISDAGDIIETVDRSVLVSAQTPQGFPRHELSAAYESVRGNPTDDASVAQAAGFSVTTVPGDPRAHKITTAADLRLLAWMLETESGKTV